MSDARSAPAQPTFAEATLAPLEERLQRGTQVLSRWKAIHSHGKDLSLAATMEDISEALRVPPGGAPWEFLANEPGYLDEAWQELGPSMATYDVERASDGLREEALLPGSRAMEPLDDPRLGDLPMIRAWSDTVHYALPKLLIATTALDEGLLGRRRGDPAPVSLEPLPKGVASEAVAVARVDPSKATGRLASLMQDIRTRHDQPVLADYWQGLAGWLPFLEAAWLRVAPRTGGRDYRERSARLVERAQVAVHDLGLPLPVRPKEHRAYEEVAGVLAIFRQRILPDALLDVTLIRALIDGPEAATVSPLSLAEGRSSGNRVDIREQGRGVGPESPAPFQDPP